jgi:fructose-1,6-bisphosphatase/sedoheptulose 1,7-bisphosphatase-like protein
LAVAVTPAGEHIGGGMPPAVDIAVDPLDGTTLTAQGRSGAIAVSGSDCICIEIASRAVCARNGDTGMQDTCAHTAVATCAL